MATNSLRAAAPRSLQRVLRGTQTACFATEHEPLHDSLSDAHYEPKQRDAAAQVPGRSRPLARDPAVLRAQAESQHSLNEPAYLQNSLSGADYPVMRRLTGSRFAALSSVSDPDYFLGNSMSQGDYMMPKSLRSSGLRPTRYQAMGVGRAGPVTLQRVVVASRAVEREGPLHDSFSELDYTPRE